MSEQDAPLNEFDDAKTEKSNQGIEGQRLPEIGQVPRGWSLVTVENMAKDLIGGGTPSKNKEDYWGGTIPWASVKDLDGIELSETKDYITQVGVENSATNVAPTNSVIISTRMTIGEPFLNKVEMAINQDMKAIIPDPEVASPLFLVYSLWDKDAYLKSLGRGTTVDGITTGDLSLTHLGLPPLEEQRKIASVLYTVDQAIQKTEEIIGLIRRTRKGLRQDIFTLGLDESGKLRPKKKCQETYLGKIPEEWKLRQVDEVCSEVVDCPHSTPKYTDDGILVVRTSEIDDGRFDPSEAPRVTKEGYQERISRLEPQPGDVIFTREAPIGEAFKIPEGMKLCLGQRLMQLRPKERILHPDFLVELIYSDMMQSWFERSARGSTSTHINVGDMKDLKIPLPSFSEQQRIDTVLGGIREQLYTERDYVKRLHRLKRGLMQDLLSGEVRTHDKPIGVINEVLAHG